MYVEVRYLDFSGTRQPSLEGIRFMPLLRFLNLSRLLQVFLWVFSVLTITGNAGRSFKGQDYAFGVFIVLNFVLFLVIGAGQALIFYNIHSSAMATMKGHRKEDTVIARRLFLIVCTDFCCWFPIGLMGLLASSGIPIPGVVNVLAAVFVLPINSAINPFLYTINALLERRAKKMEQKRMEKMMSRFQDEQRPQNP
nr:hypothetical protein BaRGS_024882 [Batillaria attramentaria]